MAGSEVMIEKIDLIGRWGNEDLRVGCILQNWIFMNYVFLISRIYERGSFHTSRSKVKRKMIYLTQHFKFGPFSF